MGDKNPKSRERAKKQDAIQKERTREAHDKKQAPPPPVVKGGR